MKKIIPWFIFLLLSGWAGPTAAMAEENNLPSLNAGIDQLAFQLTSQVADALTRAMHPHGVAVVMEASHTCMMMRGVQKQNSTTVTSAMRGTFERDPRTRAEFMSLLKT